MYNNRLDEEINKLLKKKEKMKEYEAEDFVLESAKDWKGNLVIKTIDGFAS
jgi:hypothetical protein